MVTNKKYSQFLNFHRNIFKQTKMSAGAIYKQGFQVKISTTTSVEDGEIKIPVNKELQLINGRIVISYEALPFLFSLEGHDKNLLLFLMAYYLKDDCTFEWNTLTVEHYLDLYETVKGKRPTYDTIRQSVVALVAKNIIRKKTIQKGEPVKYMLNPLLYPASPHSSHYSRKELIKAYGKIDPDTNRNIIDSLFVEEQNNKNSRIIKRK